MPDVTVLGTGRMGSAVARAFIQHGHEVEERATGGREVAGRAEVLAEVHRLPASDRNRSPYRSHSFAGPENVTFASGRPMYWG